MRHMNHPYEMIVRPKGRTQADEYPHKGSTWIEGRSNSWYEIELKNNSAQRVMVILSVDGVGVIDGELASYNSRGFVLEAHASIMVPGWVTSSTNAAKFVFADIAQSYAHQTNKGGNTGVIGSAWFQEKPTTHVININTSGGLFNTVLSAQPMNSSIMRQSLSGNTIGASAQSSVGTAWGDQTQFMNQQVSFIKMSPDPVSVLVLRYASADELKAMGIKLKDRLTYTKSEAFPGNVQYCSPPPVWVKNKTTT